MGRSRGLRRRDEYTPSPASTSIYRLQPYLVQFHRRGTLTLLYYISNTVVPNYTRLHLGLIETDSSEGCGRAAGYTE